jgi:hypothetical protein
MSESMFHPSFDPLGGRRRISSIRLALAHDNSDCTSVPVRWKEGLASRVLNVRSFVC